MASLPARRLLGLILAIVTLPACARESTPTAFIPPTSALLLPASSPAPASPTPSLAPSPTATIPAPTPTPCTNDLRFDQDLTIPDGTSVTPGMLVDKQWLVTNTGTCDWDSRYRLKLLSGEAMGAPNPQALYPARAGMQVTLRVIFTAPSEAGTHQSSWQAVAPDGTAFGQSISLQISVTP